MEDKSNQGTVTKLRLPDLHNHMLTLPKELTSKYSQIYRIYEELGKTIASEKNERTQEAAILMQLKFFNAMDKWTQDMKDITTSSDDTSTMGRNTVKKGLNILFNAVGVENIPITRSLKKGKSEDDAKIIDDNLLEECGKIIRTYEPEVMFHIGGFWQEFWAYVNSLFNCDSFMIVSEKSAFAGLKEEFRNLKNPEKVEPAQEDNAGSPTTPLKKP